MVRFTSETYNVVNGQKELLSRQTQELFSTLDEVDIEKDFEEWKATIVKSVKWALVLNCVNVVYNTGDNTAEVVGKYDGIIYSLVEFKKEEL